MSHRYTKEQTEFIAANTKGRSSKELTKIFNKKFKLNLEVSKIAAFKSRHGLKSGLDCRFKPGNVPFNKGKKGIFLGGKATQFKKGNRPHNYMPVGTERINGDGYVDVKIADPNQWKAKHHVVWEKHNGPVPQGHVIVFGDKDTRNFDINNLILVSRKQLLVLNKNKLIQSDSNLTRTGVIIADLYQKISECTKT